MAVGCRVAGAEVRQDLIDPAACVMNATIRIGPRQLGARERVDLEDLLQEGRPPTGGLGRGQPRRGHDGHRGIDGGGLRLGAHAARAVGIPAVVPRGHVALVRDVDQHPGEELHGLSNSMR